MHSDEVFSVTVCESNAKCLLYCSTRRKFQAVVTSRLPRYRRENPVFPHKKLKKYGRCYIDCISWTLSLNSEIARPHWAIKTWWVIYSTEFDSYPDRVALGFCHRPSKFPQFLCYFPTSQGVLPCHQQVEHNHMHKLWRVQCTHKGVCHHHSKKF